MYNPSPLPSPLPTPTRHYRSLPIYLAYRVGGGYIQQKANSLIGRPVGISLKNGTGVAGVICSVQGGEVYVMQYLYQKQFATFHYPFNQIQDLNPYPSCQQFGPYY